MKLGVWALGVALTISLVGPAHAQQVTTRGVVASIDLSAGKMRLRKINGSYQDVTIAPDARLLIDHRPGTLGQIMTNADADIVAWRDPQGGIHGTEVRIAQPLAPTRLAAVTPGSIIEGVVAGIFPSTSTIVLNTPTGYRNVPLGTAPIVMNGKTITPFDLSLGDRVQIQQAVQGNGFQPIPTMAVVTTPQLVAGKRQTFRSSAAVTPLAAVPASVPTTTTATGSVNIEQPSIVITPASAPGTRIISGVGTATVVTTAKTTHKRTRHPTSARKRHKRSSTTK